MLCCTACTRILPESINYRKPTLREYALAEHARLEKSSIELVEMKTMEEELKEEPASNADGHDLNSTVVISVTEENHTETLVHSDNANEASPDGSVTVSP